MFLGRTGTRMRIEQIIRQTYARMIAGHRFAMKECDAFRDAIWKEARRGQVEAMMLFFAEALHDSEGYDTEGVARVLRYVDGLMLEFIEKTDDGTWNMDDLRLRVFGKTGFMFAMSEEDREHIAGVLKEAGYNVTLYEPEEEK